MKGRWRGSWEEKGRTWAASVGGDTVAGHGAREDTVPPAKTPISSLQKEPHETTRCARTPRWRGWCPRHLRTPLPQAGELERGAPLTDSCQDTQAHLSRTE